MVKKRNPAQNLETMEERKRKGKAQSLMSLTTGLVSRLIKIRIFKKCKLSNSKNQRKDLNFLTLEITEISAPKLVMQKMKIHRLLETRKKMEGQQQI